MTVQVEPSNEDVREVFDGLAAEFSGVVPRAVVSRTVLDARQDLDGQIMPNALAEMLHHLARHRLISLHAPECRTDATG
ncbi:hypothetical protein V1227_09580 [Lentzea sp. DG1S-22]|uniref:hypothetical protein n=1 Tax=Lentzea sp. DG1S-22 TaxID=3108822 RepID=UPI002E79D8A0|nr:hypothetical protein [Lentzea sp. DG1S-22]WVH82978.1 hypothetical protein V1227_09580 [Lentzea sp. DG1S-22]